MRRTFIILGTLFAVLAVAIALLPFWLGPVAHFVAHRAYSQFGRYERVGYGHFALTDVVVNPPGNVRVKVDRVETETPAVWFWHHLTGHGATITIRHWSVEVLPSTEAKSTVPSRAGAVRTRVVLFHVANGLEHWAPSVDLGSGKVTWTGGGLSLDTARWRSRTIIVTGLEIAGHRGAVEGTFAKGEGPLNVTVRSESDPAWKFEAVSQPADLTGIFTWLGQKAEVATHLPPTGWMPERATVAGEQWAIPAARLSLGTMYNLVHGEAHFTWEAGKFMLVANASGDPLPKTKAPPLNAQVHVSGTRGEVTVNTLTLSAPGVQAKLAAPVELGSDWRPRSGASKFTVAVQLEKQPWLPGAKGEANGEVTWAAPAKGLSRLDGTVAAHDLKVGAWAVKTVAATWTLDWPRLTIANATIGLADSGAVSSASSLTLSGDADLGARTILAARIEGGVRPSLIAPWLPAWPTFDEAALKIAAHGPFDALEHAGRVEVKNLRVSGVNPLAVAADWRGRGRAVEVSSLTAQAGASEVTLAGTWDGSGAQLTNFKLTQGSDERLTLAHPAIVKVNAPAFSSLAIDSLELAGPDSSVVFAGSFGEAGKVSLRAKNFLSDWLADFLPGDGAHWRLATLAVDGEWHNGPVSFASEGSFALTLAPQRAALLAFKASGDGHGIKLASLRVAEGEAAIVTASGEIPLTLHPREPQFMRFEADAPLILTASTASNPAFWQALAETTGLDFDNPEVNVTLSGTWSDPRGEITARAGRLAVDPQRLKFPLPKIEALDLHATANNAEVKLDRFTAKVDGQAVSVSGSLPVARAQWPELQHAPLDYVRREGTLRVEIPDADVAAIARHFPRYLAPTGRLKISAEIARGGQMSGSFQLHDAATRPIGPLGVLQQLEADVKLEGRTIRIERVTAQTGGQAVAIAGRVELPATGEPRFDLTLKGENLPLVRQTGLLVRADLDLKLATAGRDTAVTGAVKMRDSMFLTDVRAFIPRGGVSDPLRRPPFFAVDLPPMNAWRLNVDLRGDKFLRVRTPLFNGLASAHFKLGGTLGEPRAVGEATIDSGTILLPFANFRVEQGGVRLTETEPYTLRVNMTATSRRYGYDLRMEMTGTATDPIVAFTSSPPLENSQVLLLVTAGEVPQDEITYGANQRVARLGTYLGQSLITGFGGDSTEADRLSISTGERVSEQGRETYDIEYRLNDRYSLIGEYDEFDDYNAGVKWRIFLPKDQPAKPKGRPKPLFPKEDNDARR